MAKDPCEAISSELDEIFEQINSTDNKEKLEECYRQLIEHSRNKTMLVFISGSMSEISRQEQVVSRFDLDEDLVDEDLITCDTGILAFSLRYTVPERFDGQLVRIHSEGHHSGFVRLHHTQFRRDLKLIDFVDWTMGHEHGPADLQRTRDINTRIHRDFPQYSEEIEDGGEIAEMCDNVSGVHSPHWPLEANEWISRRRLYKSPSKSVLEKVVRYGCDFVKMSNKVNPNSNEWRFSFSKAETIIIQNCTTAQRIMYRALHVLNKIMKSTNDDSVLCSYFFKTLVLWAAEEKPAHFWIEYVMAYMSVCELLLQFAKWMQIRCCPNYFIPSNNMMDHLCDIDLFQDIDDVYCLLQNRELIAKALYESRHFELIDRNAAISIEAPMWVYTSLVIDDQLHSEYRRTRPAPSNFSRVVQQSYSWNLRDMFKGLMLAQNASSSVSHYYAISCLRRSFEHLAVPIFSNKVSSRRYARLQCSEDIANSILHIQFKGSSKSKSEDDLKETPTAERLTRNLSVKKAIKIVLHTDTHDDAVSYSSDRVYNELPAHSPTVNISWFITKTYLAIHYYHAGCYEALEDLCDNILSVCNQSAYNRIIADNQLPFVLSTECAAIYDEDVRLILGFYSLCTFMFNKTDRSRSVYLCCIPVQFALYLKCRSSVNHLRVQPTIRRHAELPDKLRKILQQMKEHDQQGKSDPRVCYGVFAMRLLNDLVVRSGNELMERIGKQLSTFQWE